MAKDRTKDLTRGTPWKVIAGFSLPVIGGNLFQLFYTLADSMIVGRTLGADALAAVGATATIVYFVLCFIQGLTADVEFYWDRHSAREMKSRYANPYRRLYGSARCLQSY